jgi:hypothetical protein
VADMRRPSVRTSLQGRLMPFYGKISQIHDKRVTELPLRHHTIFFAEGTTRKTNRQTGGQCLPWSHDGVAWAKRG